MLPWGHAAFGYLLYRFFLWRGGRHPSGSVVVVLGVGTQFPDLIDKPLAWTFGVLPSGRSLGHSVFTLVIVSALLFWVLSPMRRRVVLAFAGGWASHLVADGLHGLAGGELVQFGYLFWPVTSAPIDDEGRSFLEFFLGLEPTPAFLVELGLVVVVFVIWAHDGFPGLQKLISPFEAVTRDPDREV